MLNLDYDDLYKLSILQPEKVWHELAQEVIWDQQYTDVLIEKESPTPKWFVGGKINMSYNCLDRHVLEGYGNKIAILHESPNSPITIKITYKELLDEVELLAGVMVDKCNIRSGDKVLLYFPVIPQCMIGILACTRIGATYSAVYGGFSSGAIATKIDHIEPYLILTCNVAYNNATTENYKETIDKAIMESKHKPQHCIIYNRPGTVPASLVGHRDLDWEYQMQGARHHRHVPLDSNHPILIIYTSGSTGEPKGMVCATGNIVASDKYVMKYQIGLKSDEVGWFIGDFAWLTGQLFMTFGVLLNRGTSILYEGYPEDSAILEMMRLHKPAIFFSSPIRMRKFRKNLTEVNFSEKFDNLKSFFIGGELTDDTLRNWISSKFHCPVYDIWGQTELHSIGVGPNLGLKRKDYSQSVPVLGMNFKIIDSKTGETLRNETLGRIVIKTPITPSLSMTFYKDHERYIRTYFTRYPMNNGSIRINSRVDDVIRLAGHRVSSWSVEEICLKNENISGVVVLPLEDILNTNLPVALIVKNEDSRSSDEEIKIETVQLVQHYLGKFILFQKVVIVPCLLETKSGKFLRRSLTDMINGKDYKMSTMVNNPGAYQLIYDVLINHGFKATLPRDFKI